MGFGLTAYSSLRMSETSHAKTNNSTSESGTGSSCSPFLTAKTKLFFRNPIDKRKQTCYNTHIETNDEEKYRTYPVPREPPMMEMRQRTVREWPSEGGPNPVQKGSSIRRDTRPLSGVAYLCTRGVVVLTDDKSSGTAGFCTKSRPDSAKI